MYPGTYIRYLHFVVVTYICLHAAKTATCRARNTLCRGYAHKTTAHSSCGLGSGRFSPAVVWSVDLRSNHEARTAAEQESTAASAPQLLFTCHRLYFRHLPRYVSGRSSTHTYVAQVDSGMPLIIGNLTQEELLAIVPRGVIGNVSRYC